MWQVLEGETLNKIQNLHKKTKTNSPPPKKKTSFHVTILKEMTNFMKVCG